MKLSFAVVVALFTCFASAQQPTLQAPRSPTNSIAWGSTVNGLRLGVAFGSGAAKPTLRVVLENVGPEVRDVFIGYENGRGPVYSLKFVANVRGGKVREGSDIAMFFPVEGLVQPVALRLDAGAKHEIVFPLENIIYSSRTDTLETLVKNGYRVLVLFEANTYEPSFGIQPPSSPIAGLES